MWGGGGLLPSNQHWPLKKALSICNRMSFLKFLRQKITISKFLSDTFWENTSWEGRGVIHPLITLNLKKGIKTSDYQPNEPIRSTTTLSIKFYMPQVNNLQPLPRGRRGVVNLKDIISGPFKYVKQNGYLKVLYWMCLEECWACEGVSSPLIIFD